MVDVVRAVAAPAAVQTPAAVDVTDAQDATVLPAPGGFQIGNPLAGVLGNLPPAAETHGREAASTIDWRVGDRKSRREFHCGIYLRRKLRAI